MLFSHHTHLPFKGLKKIQALLEEFYNLDSNEDTLVVTASIPSLNSTQKLQLIEEITKHQKIIFWCYGDFLWNLSFFKEMESNFIDKKIIWVMASERWANLGRRYIPEENIAVLGHPFQVQNFHPGRKSLRDELSLNESDKLLFYAGRLSLSKNIPLILKVWDDLQKESETKIKLMIAGSACSYQSFIELYYKMDIKSYPTGVKAFQSMHSDSVYIHEDLNESQMSQYLSASDLAMSASSFYEEDYGLFLREARSVGCPVLASDWGGHGDLKDKGSFLFNLQSETILFKAKEALASKRFSYNYCPENILFSSIPLNKFSGFKKTNNDLLTPRELELIMLGL